MIVLETKRLVLRYAEPADAGPLAALWSDAEVMRHMGGPRDFDRVRSLVEEEARAAERPRFGMRTLIRRQDSSVIGDCGLIEKEVDGRAEIELCYIIAAEHWGQGYATEIAGALLAYATNVMNLERVIALIDPANTASGIVAGNIGMRLERDTVRPSGKTMQVYVWESR